jgi:hypothetical protein
MAGSWVMAGVGLGVGAGMGMGTGVGAGAGAPIGNFNPLFMYQYAPAATAATIMMMKIILLFIIIIRQLFFSGDITECPLKIYQKKFNMLCWIQNL